MQTKHSLSDILDWILMCIGIESITLVQGYFKCNCSSDCNIHNGMNGFLIDDSLFALQLEFVADTIVERLVVVSISCGKEQQNLDSRNCSRLIGLVAVGNVEVDGLLLTVSLPAFILIVDVIKLSQKACSSRHCEDNAMTKFSQLGLVQTNIVFVPYR